MPKTTIITKTDRMVRNDPRFQLICSKLNETTDPYQQQRLRTAMALLVAMITGAVS